MLKRFARALPLSYRLDAQMGFEINYLHRLLHSFHQTALFGPSPTHGFLKRFSMLTE